MPDHLFIQNASQSISFANSSGGGQPANVPARETQVHGSRILELLTAVNAQNVELQVAHRLTGLPVRQGVYMEFQSAANYDLIVKSLENIGNGIRLSNVRTTESQAGDITFATVFVPTRQEEYFIRKVNEYLDPARDSQSGMPRNNLLVSSIESVETAVIESFWTDTSATIPRDHAVWCEAWLAINSTGTTDEVNARKITLLSEFILICELYDIEIIPEETLLFPERLIVMIKTNREQFLRVIESVDFLAELRLAREAASFWVQQSNADQLEWVRDLRQRMTFLENNVSVSLLDTGVNNGHLLLAPVLPDARLLALSVQWSGSDDNGHGSLMAGVAQYGDLIVLLEESEPIDITHCLTSVKLVPPPNFPPNNPQFYGYLTQQAISIAEIALPHYKHIFCSAVTSWTIKHRGRPTSYSAAIDQITSGQLDDQRRLYITSAGNVWDSQIWAGYPDTNLLEPVQDPAQSWNALTVGAYTEKVVIRDQRYNGHSSLAPMRGLSPYSSTSHSWEKRWPMKPDVVFEGGNIRKAPDGSLYENFDDFSILSTSHRSSEQFDIISATSAATAYASWMAAKIQYAYPAAWPETIKGLMIHSAEWPTEVISQFALDLKRKADVQTLIRICGYGVPNFERAISSRNNALTLVSQETIQPFRYNDSNKPSVNEMHIYELPWPRDILLALAESPVRLRVTLCYFIEPGPGEVGWKERYRYSSHALRFDLNRPNESKEEFMKRVNVAEREEGDEVDTNSGSGRWTVGADNRSLGSVHSDIWNGTAAEIATSNLIGVYPVIGWWRERAHLGKVTAETRYSLIVSLDTPVQDVDIYTPVATAIATAIPVTTRV